MDADVGVPVLGCGYWGADIGVQTGGQAFWGRLMLGRIWDANEFGCRCWGIDVVVLMLGC